MDGRGGLNHEAAELFTFGVSGRMGKEELPS